MYVFDCSVTFFPFFFFFFSNYRELDYNLQSRKMNRTNTQHHSLIQTPSNVNQLFHSHVSPSRIDNQKVIRHSQTKSGKQLSLQSSSDSELFPQESDFCNKSRNVLKKATVALAKLKCKAKMLEKYDKFLKFKVKYTKLLSQSNSTAFSNESNPSSSPHSFSSQNQNTQQDSYKGQTQLQQEIYQTSKVTLHKQSMSNSMLGLIEFKNQAQNQKFRILKYINQGVSGKVYLAQNINNYAIYSIKVISRAMIDKTLEHQLIRQIKIQTFLNHPNIVKLYHFFIDQENIYLVLEPCLGNDLYKNLKNNSDKFSQKQVKDIVKQTCLAVDFMHSNNIIHRDLKPQNILLHERCVKICDFGWAIYSPLLRDTRCGTPLYTSPEMLKKDSYDSKIDIWSIGVMTYQLLYGDIPFEIRCIQDLQKIIQEDIYFSKSIHVSEAAQHFMNGAMNKNPVQRYSIKQALQHQFLNSNDKFRWTIV